MPTDKIPYTKPKIITCKDCVMYATCLERSRMYICKDFKDATRRTGDSETASG